MKLKEILLLNLVSKSRRSNSNVNIPYLWIVLKYTQFCPVFLLPTGLFFIFLLGFIILFIQYYSAICRPSDHTEIRTRAGRPRSRDTTPRPPHLLVT